MLFGIFRMMIDRVFELLRFVSFVDRLSVIVVFLLFFVLRVVMVGVFVIVFIVML